MNKEKEFSLFGDDEPPKESEDGDFTYYDIYEKKNITINLRPGERVIQIDDDRVLIDDIIWRTQSKAEE